MEAAALARMEAAEDAIGAAHKEWLAALDNLIAHESGPGVPKPEYRDA
jgi:hypothetical protein